jgi:2-polyprenyl-6-methoxyphenol hydroxylase-like FAD-dependent oxidoreductase
LFAANLLRTIGWDVVVFERATGDLASRGAAIGLTQELRDVMSTLGLRLSAAAGTNVRSYIALDRSGAVTHELARQAATGAWSQVYRPLREALPADCYRSGVALARIAQDDHAVTASLSDGSSESGDLLIGADGIYSTVRQLMSPAARPAYAGYVAWRGIIDEAEIEPFVREQFLNHLVFCFPGGELLLSIPIPADEFTGKTARGQRCCYIWYRAADAEHGLPRLCTDASGRQHGMTIPPPLIRDEVISELKADAQALLPPVVAAMVDRASRPLFQAIFDLESARLVFGRVVLLGDAAFVARPHVVAGVSKAALDAKYLADALADHAQNLPKALAHYEHERHAFGSRIVAHARHLGAFLGNADDAGPDAPSGLRPDIMLRDYGAPHLLRA